MSSHSISYRLFGLGRMPESVRNEIAGETVRFQVEGIPVRIHQSGRVPGAIKKRGITALSGGIAITDRRVVGTGRRKKLVDVPWDIEAEGPATVAIEEGGVRVHFDLDRIHPSFRGEMRMDFNAAIPANVLAQIPWSMKSFPVSDPQAVMRTFGSLRKLPDAS